MVVKRFADKDVNNASFFPTEGFGISRGVGVGGGVYRESTQQGMYEATILDKSNEKLRPFLSPILMMKKWHVLLCAWIHH